MATLRSTLPLRVRQLLSGEGAVSPSFKVESEPPHEIKTFIDKVIQSPLQNIAIPLFGFRWEYSKGNFHHWRLLFLHFDTYFKTYLACRNDLLLSDNILEDNPFPKHEVLQILRVIQTILENCHNKSSFVGLEHFKLLLASTDPEILIATLETLSALVKINSSKIHSSGKLIGCGSLNSCLLSLAQGWGSKEEGLGLYSCVVANEKTQEGLSLFPSEMQNDWNTSQRRLGSTLYFEIHCIKSQSPGENIDSTRSSNSMLIHIPDIHLRSEDDLLIMKQYIEEYNVPHLRRFALMSRIRYARAFRSPRICRLYSRICLLAFIVLVQSNDANDEIVSFFANETEYTNELISLVRSEETIPKSIKTLAMLALGAQLAAYASSHQRSRILSGLNINFSGSSRMILLNVLQKEILSLNNSNDPSSCGFVESLLQFYLLHVISSSNSLSVVRGSGMVPTFLHLLGDSDPTHMQIVCIAVKTLQKLLDYSTIAVTLFKDLGGVELLANRLQIEVHRVIGMVAENNNLTVIGECKRVNDGQLHSQVRLIKILLKALGSSTYGHINTTTPQNSHDTSVPITLSLIFRNAEKFGGDIYSSAVTVMSEIIHKDPTCIPSLHELGLPDAFLSSVITGMLPYSKAITSVPNGLGAICLNAKGLESVKEKSVLRFLVDVFITKKYVVAMSDGIVPFANAVEELLRHASSLRITGVEIIIEIIDRMASTGDNICIESAIKIDANSEMDSGDLANDGSFNVVNVADSSSEGISDEQYIHLCIFHVMVLVHRTMENSETCRLFVEKSGIEALFKLLLRPNIAQSSEGMSIALHSSMVFKGFIQHHSAPVARAFCITLRDQMKVTLIGFDIASGSFLLEPKKTPDSDVFSSLFLIEFLLFLAASKDNRWVTALLTEFGNESKDVLEDIGCIHREVLWQISLLDDAKLELENVVVVSAGDQQDLTANETEEQRYNSFRQFLDPLLRRRSEWTAESQFLDLINLYRDLGRTNGLQQNTGSDGLSNLHSGSSHQLHHTNSSDVPGDRKNKDENKRSYYSSCCDMIRSLSFHITHLFQELGKVMLVPSRRREDTLNISPSSKSVASTFAFIALAHMNSGVHESHSGSDALIETKCRYFGKVIDFIDVILLDKPDSCNPILLNCLYGHGVVQSVLTTFEATSQLLFSITRARASMVTDDVQLKQFENENSWIYGSIASYAKFMDHLTTSSSILSPITKHMLAQPLLNSNVPFPRDAETFVKVLQSMVLKVVLPVWTHSRFTDCSHNFISAVISIIRHVYSGVEVKDVNSNDGALIPAPPLNESIITTIVDMGFSRYRAEEALRHVGTNSVELAMDWLFSHPEEIPEDDELARVLAMSLGNSGPDVNRDVSSETMHLEQEIIQLPPVDELLATCAKLLQMRQHLTFPVRDLLVTICSKNDGELRSNVISFLVDQVRCCGLKSDGINNAMLSSLFHVLALILHDDAVARDVSFNSGLVKLASDLLSKWDSGSFNDGNPVVLKWVTAAFLAIDQMVHVDQKLNSEIVEQLKKDAVSTQSHSITIDEKKKNILQFALGSSSKHIDIYEQKRLIEIACSGIRNQLPSETMHAILHLCATLTKNHSVAVSFLDDGGLPLLLSLPTSSLFSGFDNIAATIIRHILEDPQTLQQAMESEIRYVMAFSCRHSNGRLTPHNFLLNLSLVISRDPAIFMQAAQSVCQIEMVGERSYVVLVKDRDKDKFKERERSSEQKQQNIDGKVMSNMSSTDLGSGQGKHSDSNSKKAHRKSPHSFINVIELLLDSLIASTPCLSDDYIVNVLPGTLLLADIDIDIVASKGKGKAIATTLEESEAADQEASAELAKIAFILKLLTEILLMYGGSVHILVRRDAEISSFRGSQRDPTGSDGIFHHILHNFLPCSRNSKGKKMDGYWMNQLWASKFLVASCVRSAEARKRVFGESNNIFNDFVDSSSGIRVPSGDIQAYIDLLNDVLAARLPSGSYISAEASRTFIDAGLVTSLTRVLQVLDLDYADSSKVVIGLVKALELVTKEHVHSSDSNIGKIGNTTQVIDHNQLESSERDGDLSHPLETMSELNHDSVAAEHVASLSNVQTYGSSESVTDDMEHDQDLDDGFAHTSEDDYMQETSRDTQEFENVIDSVGVRFEIQSHAPENLEDDEISENDRDENEDDVDHNDMEDEVHHLPHPATNHGDHEIDEEFDEEVLEEEDGDDEDGVILSLEEGINGMNVFDHIEVFGRDNNFPDDTLRVMPAEFHGSRGQGRSASIFNLLGRTGDNAVSPQHPLLLGPSSLQTASLRQSGNAREMSFSDRNSGNTSLQLETVFRSLRNGHRLDLWGADSQLSSSSTSFVVPEGLEELLVSQLKQPTPEKPSDNISNVKVQNKGDTSQLQESKAGARPEIASENNTNNDQVPTSGAVDGSTNFNIRLAGSEIMQDVHSQSVEMQFEHTDAVIRDAEAVSQGSSGSGATLGESLRSLDVEIGSADGHDDGGERQGSADRLPFGDMQPNRSRRINVSFGNSSLTSGMDLSLHSVTEVSENPSGEGDQGVEQVEHQISDDADADSESIDPAFVDALPEELRTEIISAQHGQVAQTSTTEQQNDEEIDPEFLAALPPDIRAEVLAQQHAQRVHQSHELEGQPVEMDTVSIIATFPPELREEVLLTSPDTLLANLTPALVAEANMLRERFASRYQNRPLFGMYSRSRRGETSRRGDGVGDRSGDSTSQKSSGSKPVEVSGCPLVNSEALKAMIRLLRVVQPLYKGQFQKLLLNLSAHNESRIALVTILMDMLMLDTRKPVNNLNVDEPSYRLYACQSHVMYSRPQSFDGVPPLVSRRILETLTYLARNHPYVARNLLLFKIPQPLQEVDNHDQVHGKDVIFIEDGTKIGQNKGANVSIALLLGLLNQPLYLRSLAHLEQLLHLLEVIIDSVGNKSISSDVPVTSTTEQPFGPQMLASDVVVSTDLGTSSSGVEVRSLKADDFIPSTSGTSGESDSQTVLLNLPQAELQLLCSFLAQESLSDNVYNLVAEVLRKLVAIIPFHSHLFVTELSKSVQNLSISAMNELQTLGASENAFLGTLSCNGAAVLRVMQALSFLVDSLSDKLKKHLILPEDYTFVLSQIRDINAALEPFYVEVSICISKVENYSDSVAESSTTVKSSCKTCNVMTSLPPGTQNILPYIESFFVMCEKLHPEQLGFGQDWGIAMISDAEDIISTSGSQQKTPVTIAKVNEKHAAFVKFCEKHRKLLNAFIRQNPGLLEKSFLLMLKVPRFIDFDNKRAHFRSKIKHQNDHHHSSVRISVRRAYILEDSYNQLRMRSTQDIKGRLAVHFQGEEGIDAGGLTREWYQLLSRVIFDKGALLFTTVGNDSTFQPNPNSVYQTEHLSYFKFVGRVVGKALFDAQLLDVHFTRSFYKHILGVKVTYHDIEAIDPDYFKNLKWVLENDISDILDLTFSIDADEEKLILYEKTEVTDYELISGGRNVRVTEENKHQYVDLVAEHRLTTAIRPQINAFLEGFNELIQRDLISLFNDKELELLISGLPDIDLDDMRLNTDYFGYTIASPVIQWFWEIAHSFSKEDKARLLQFVTGTSKVPLEGFSALQGISGSQKFQIHKAYGSPHHLPSAHTCFNQLDLPEYPSKEQLEERLLLAIHEANEGFGFG